MRARLLPAIALGILLVVLTGCVGGPDGAELDPADVDEAPPSGNLTQPVFDLVERSEHVIQGEVEGEATEEIWLDVYRPAEAEHEVPVILVMTPYQALGDGLGALSALEDEQAPPVPPSQAPYDPDLVDFFVPRGYAVAFADVRGNHNSGGCIDQSGPDQWRDGYYTVEWLAEQGWSNGNVGMHGASYDGETQLTTALLNPPSLATIVPVASVDSQYAYLHYDGVPYELQGAGTMGAYLAISAVPGTDTNAVSSYPERWTCQPENLEHALDLSGDWNTYWEERAYWKLAERSNVSMLRVHGLQDWNVKPDHIDPSTPRWEGEPKRAIYGQWGHAYPDRPDWGGQGGILHRWYDAFLYEKPTGIVEDLPPVLLEDSEDRWHGSEAFGPTDGEQLQLQLDPDGTLVTSGASEGEATIHDHPRGGQGTGTDGTMDPLVTEAAHRASQPARLVFETEPLEEQLVIAGRPTVSFEASTEAESTHWVAHLERVDEDGEAEWIDRGYQDARHRAGLDDPKPLEPGEAYDVEIEMFPQADVLQPGERLRLVITNQDGWVHQDTTYAESTVQLGPSAVLEVPLLPDDAERVDEDTLEPPRTDR